MTSKTNQSSIPKSLQSLMIGVRSHNFKGYKTVQKPLRTLLVLFLFMVGINNTKAQQWQWVETAGGPSGVNITQDNDGGNDIEVTSNGDLLLTGYYKDTADFDTVSVSGSGLSNGFIARYDSLGNVYWAHGVFGGNVRGISVKENSLGEIFLLGEFSDTAIFESDTLIVSSNNFWQNEIFLAKYDAYGNFLWVKKSSVNTQSNHQPVEIEINDQNEVYLSARISGPIQLDTILISAPSGTSLLAKFNANGDALWAKVLIDNYNEYLTDMSLDQDGNVYVTGSYQYNMIVNGNYILGHPTSDPFIMKFDSNGNFNWANVGFGLSNNWANAIDASLDGSIYVYGTFDGVLEFDSLSITADGYYDDIYILKLDSSGNEQWVETMHGNGVMEAYDLISDQFGNFYVSGLFWDSAQIDSVQLLVGAPWVGQTFIASYQSNGDLNWATQSGDTNANHDLYAKSIALESCADLVVAGRMKQTASFDAITISSTGLDDAFFGRISNSVSRSIVGNTILCPGDTTHLTAIGGANYLWLPDSVYGNQISIHPDSTTQYYLTGIACNGSIFTDSILVTILELDSIAPTMYICNGDSAFILGAFRDTSGFYTQTFVSSHGCDSLFTQELVVSTFTTTTLSNDTICANQFAIIFGDTVYTSGTYNDTLTSGLGCDSIVFKTLVILPIHTTNLPTDTICNGDYAVIFGDTHFISGTYIDTVFTVNGCDSILFKSLFVDTIDTSITNTGTQLSANQSGGVYQWIDCSTGLPISGATNQTFHPIASGSYAVYINYQNCADTSSCDSINIVGIEEISQLISIYPNPAKDWVVLNNSGLNQVELEIYNTVGQLVLTQENLNIGTTQFSIKDFAPGMYLFLIKSQGFTVQKTVILKGQ